MHDGLSENRGKGSEARRAAQCGIRPAAGGSAHGLELPGGEGKQELYFNEIIAYEKKLDFLSARDKCRTYVEMYPTDEEGAKELEFLNTRG